MDLIWRFYGQKTNFGQNRAYAIPGIFRKKSIKNSKKIFELRKIQNKCEIGCSNSRNKPGVKTLKNVEKISFFVTLYAQKLTTLLYTKYFEI